MSGPGSVPLDRPQPVEGRLVEPAVRAQRDGQPQMGAGLLRPTQLLEALAERVVRVVRRRIDLEQRLERLRRERRAGRCCSRPDRAPRGSSPCAARGAPPEPGPSRPARDAAIASDRDRAGAGRRRTRAGRRRHRPGSAPIGVAASGVDGVEDSGRSAVGSAVHRSDGRMSGQRPMPHRIAGHARGRRLIRRRPRSAVASPRATRPDEHARARHQHEARRRARRRSSSRCCPRASADCQIDCGRRGARPRRGEVRRPRTRPAPRRAPTPGCSPTQPDLREQPVDGVPRMRRPPRSRRSSGARRSASVAAAAGPSAPLEGGPQGRRRASSPAAAAAACDLGPLREDGSRRRDQRRRLVELPRRHRPAARPAAAPSPRPRPRPTRTPSRATRRSSSRLRLGRPDDPASPEVRVRRPSVRSSSRSRSPRQSGGAARRAPRPLRHGTADTRFSPSAAACQTSAARPRRRAPRSARASWNVAA